MSASCSVVLAMDAPIVGALAFYQRSMTAVLVSATDADARSVLHRILRATWGEPLRVLRRLLKVVHDLHAPTWGASRLRRGRTGSDGWCGEMDGADVIGSSGRSNRNMMASTWPCSAIDVDVPADSSGRNKSGMATPYR